MTGLILLDSLLSLEITITVAIVDVEGTLLTSVGIREDLLHQQQQLLILRVSSPSASSPTAPSSVASFGQASGSNVTLSTANFEAIVN